VRERERAREREREKRKQRERERERERKRERERGDLKGKTRASEKLVVVKGAFAELLQRVYIRAHEEACYRIQKYFA